ILFQQAVCKSKGLQLIGRNIYIVQTLGVYLYITNVCFCVYNVCICMYIYMCIYIYIYIHGVERERYWGGHFDYSIILKHFLRSGTELFILTMGSLTLEDFKKAKEVVGQRVGEWKRTPLLCHWRDLGGCSRITQDCDLYLKMENTQVTGACMNVIIM